MVSISYGHELEEGENPIEVYRNKAESETATAPCTGGVASNTPESRLPVRFDRTRPALSHPGRTEGEDVNAGFTNFMKVEGGAINPGEEEGQEAGAIVVFKTKEAGKPSYLSIEGGWAVTKK